MPWEALFDYRGVVRYGLRIRVYDRFVSSSQLSHRQQMHLFTFKLGIFSCHDHRIAENSCLVPEKSLMCDEKVIPFHIRDRRRTGQNFEADRAIVLSISIEMPRRTSGKTHNIRGNA